MTYNVATGACFFFSQCSYGLLAIPMVSNVHYIGSRDIVIHFRIMSMNECGFDIFENVFTHFMGMPRGTRPEDPGHFLTPQFPQVSKKVCFIIIYFFFVEKLYQNEVISEIHPNLKSVYLIYFQIHKNFIPLTSILKL